MDTALTGGQAREGVVEDTYSFARLLGAGAATPSSRPAGQKSRKRTTGGRRHGQQDRESLNGRTQRPTCVSPTGHHAPSMLPARGPRRCISDTCVRSSQEGVGGFAGQWCARHTVIRVLVVHRMGMVVGSCKTERAARSLTRLTGRPRAERKHSLAWAVALGSA